jgi:hypothetical protein
MFHIQFSFSNACHVSCPLDIPWLNHATNKREMVQITKLLIITQFPQRWILSTYAHLSAQFSSFNTHVRVRLTVTLKPQDVFMWKNIKQTWHHRRLQMRSLPTHLYWVWNPPTLISNLSNGLSYHYFTPRPTKCQVRATTHPMGWWQMGMEQQWNDD